MINIDQLRSEIFFKAVRSRGPGGQNVNRVSSAAILNWDFSHSRLLSDAQKQQIKSKLYSFINTENLLYLRSDEYRDLERNKARCLEKLAELLEKAFYVPKKRKATKPTKASKRKRREEKDRRSEIKKLRRSNWND